MKKFLQNAKRIYFAYRDENNNRKLIPIRGLYVARRVDENGNVILINTQNNKQNDGE